jgi:hypothetical protein
VVGVVIVEYKHVIGKEKSDLKLLLNKLKSKGFTIRWDHLRRRYNVRRRIDNEEIHIIIRKKRSEWIAVLHVDIIKSDFPSMVHVMSRDKNKINHLGRLIFS